VHEIEHPYVSARRLSVTEIDGHAFLIVRKPWRVKHRWRCKTAEVLPVAGAAFASAALFYLTTNFAVWAAGQLYPKTLSGLVACYVAAIPFFGPTLASDLFYSAVLFGGFAWAERRFSNLSPAAA